MSKPKQLPAPTIPELIDLLVKRFPEDYVSIERHYNSNVYTHTHYNEPTRHTKEEYTLYIGNHSNLNQLSIPSYNLLVAYVMHALEAANGD